MHRHRTSRARHICCSSGKRDFLDEGTIVVQPCHTGSGIALDAVDVAGVFVLMRADPVRVHLEDVIEDIDILSAETEDDERRAAAGGEQDLDLEAGDPVLQRVGDVPIAAPGEGDLRPSRNRVVDEGDGLCLHLGPRIHVQTVGGRPLCG